MPYELRTTLTGSSLDAYAIAGHAVNSAVGFDIDDDARRRVAASRETAVRVAERRPVYGRTTGVGANRSVEVAAGREQDLRLLKSHATGSGDELPHGQVRAAMMVRLNQLLVGGSGMHPAIIDALSQALHDDDLPRVRAFGPIGTGDLTSFAEIGLGLAGLVPWKAGGCARIGGRGPVMPSPSCRRTP